MCYKLIYFVPDSHADVTKEAIFEAGAGMLGDYSHCAWQVLGEGQFKPLEGSDPHIGSQGEVAKVPEWRIEVLVPKERARAVVDALLKAHPYEEAAFELHPLIDPHSL